MEGGSLLGMSKSIIWSEVVTWKMFYGIAKKNYIKTYEKLVVFCSFTNSQFHTKLMLGTK